jgi:hypothetical protein
MEAVSPPACSFFCSAIIVALFLSATARRFDSASLMLQKKGV